MPMSTIYPGLVSITFRKLTPTEYLFDLVAQAQLTGIEWGGDVHVPHGDIATAHAVRRQTVNAGLQVAAYGSYYRVSHEETGPFDAVLAAAVALEAPAIRVWAGRQGTEAADDAYWAAVIEDSRRIADLAAVEGIKIAYEFHGNTLTDTNDSAHLLLERVDHPNVRSYWQPPRHSAVDYNLIWDRCCCPMAGQHSCLSMAEREWGAGSACKVGQADWSTIFGPNCTGGWGAICTLMEFVQNDEPAAFLRDAAILKTWLLPYS